MTRLYAMRRRGGLTRRGRPIVLKLLLVLEARAERTRAALRFRGASVG
jgi:hypothetical protein